MTFLRFLHAQLGPHPKTYLLTALLLLLLCPAWGQQKYWIFFSDKGEKRAYKAEELLCGPALERRRLQGIAIDWYDYPVHAAYLRQLRAMKAEVLRTSRWLNAVSARLDAEMQRQVLALPFVKGIQPVAGLSRPAGILAGCDTLPDLNTPARQLNMLGLDVLHAARYTGQGVIIAVFDNGFRQADKLEALQHIWEDKRLLAAYDFVDGDGDVFEACAASGFCNHGTNVLSVLAARQAEGLRGSAPDATYILLRTENDASETHQEEDNWVAAAEYADSLGADIFTTSLGYSTFDPGQGDYSRDDMDGATAIITLAADMAAAKGIVVVNSAGNSGTRGLTAPADGKAVIAVGAVDQCERYSSFSSQGPTADGRIKPDVAAMGQATYVINPSGEMRRANGTSFACPLISGMLACLKQARPQATREQLYQSMIRSASQYSQPDTLLGYGIPRAPLAFELLTGRPLAPWPQTALLAQQAAVLYPNPSTGDFFLAMQYQGESLPLRLEITDVLGRRLWVQHSRIDPGPNRFEYRTGLQPGTYLLRILNLQSSNTFWATKVVVLP
ncbi:MAG: T9SS C-terminal target domain-containing protein [Bacteroidetes bacterium]|nr:MAG: T9SS C-terminal target domain-containing protein [Bacteroidota bacterium]